MENTQLQGSPSAPDGDEMMIDIEVIELINQLKLARQAAVDRMNSSRWGLNQVEQAEVLGYLIREKRARKLADASQYDEEAMAEAARAMKRRRTNSNPNFSDAQKMFAHGPEQQPSAFDRKRRREMADIMMDNQLLGLCVDFQGAFSGDLQDMRHVPKTSEPDPGPTYKPGFNLLESVCSSVWLAVEVAKHLRPSDIVNLYSTSKSFHDILDQHWQSSIVAWAEHMAPSSFRIFYWKFFGAYARTDPTGTTWEAPGQFADAIPHPPWAKRRPVTEADKEVRSVPGLRYLAMLVKRDVRVRDILAKLARHGHRLPSKCHEAVKKMWLLMDLPTNTLRRAFIRSPELWTVEDIYNAQMFVTKLQMLFNEPVFGPDSPQAVETILGSPEGLTPLWQMLRGKKYTEVLEAIQMRVTYLATDQAIRRYRNWEKHYDTPRWTLGRGHLEGWGMGNVHLSRPDELLIEEAARRNLNLKDHLTYMTFWGHVDWRKRANLVPTEEEMYMSDDELPALTAQEKGPDGILGNCGNVLFEGGEWRPEHALLARWDTLTEQQKQCLRVHVAHEKYKMAVHEDDDDGFWDLTSEEMRLLSIGTKPNTTIDAQETYRREGEPESDEDASKEGPAEEHDDNCVCTACLPDFDNHSHDGSCVCEECQDEVDFWAEREAAEEEVEEEDEDEEDNGNNQQQQQNPVINNNTLAIPPTVPMPQEILQNTTLLDAWNSLGAGDRQAVNSLIANHHEAKKAAVASATAHAMPRKFPNIRDVPSLILLHKLDGIENKPAGEEEEAADTSSGAPGGDDDDDADEEMVDEGYDSNGAGAGQTGADDDDASSDSSMDDDQLKALADLDYSDDDLDYDMGGFQALMKRGRDDGSFHYRAGGDGDEDAEGEEEDDDASGVAHEDDLKSPGLAAEMQLPDIINY